MSKKITITMTPTQAQALLYAAGNTLDWEEDAIAVFGNKRSEMNAAYKAYAIIREALDRTKREAP